MKNKILFDNNAIDTILDNFNLFKKLSKFYSYFASPTILEELATIPDDKKEKRIKNIISMFQLNFKLINDSVFIIGHSRLNCACLGNGYIYNKILNKSKNNIKDAIIADTATINKCILYTNDLRLYNKMKKLNLNVINLEELKKVENTNE